MTIDPRDVADLVRLLEEQLEELRAVRREAAAQTELLRRLLERLESLERTQYS